MPRAVVTAGVGYRVGGHESRSICTQSTYEQRAVEMIIDNSVTRLRMSTRGFTMTGAWLLCLLQLVVVPAMAQSADALSLIHI